MDFFFGGNGFGMMGSHFKKIILQNYQSSRNEIKH